MKLEGIMLSEMSEKDKFHVISIIWNLKKKKERNRVGKSVGQSLGDGKIGRGL